MRNGLEVIFGSSKTFVFPLIPAINGQKLNRVAPSILTTSVQVFSFEKFCANNKALKYHLIYRGHTLAFTYNGRLRGVFLKFKVVSILGYFWGTFGDFISIITVVPVVKFGALEP